MLIKIERDRDIEFFLHIMFNYLLVFYKLFLHNSLYNDLFLEIMISNEISIFEKMVKMSLQTLTFVNDNNELIFHYENEIITWRKNIHVLSLFPN
jgi:hypothetical protein